MQVEVFSGRFFCKSCVSILSIACHKAVSDEETPLLCSNLFEQPNMQQSQLITLILLNVHADSTAIHPIPVY